MTRPLYRTTVLLIILVSLVGAIPISSTAHTQLPAQPTHYLVRVYYQNRANLETLAANLDIWEVHQSDVPEPYLVAWVSADELDALRAAGYKLEILPDPTEGRRTIPGYPCYRTVAELYADLGQIAADHPGLTELVDVGDSWDKDTPGGPAGYDLYVLQITNEAIPGPKPRFFLVANVHGRELITPETAMAFVDYLVANYGQDPDVTWVLNHREVHVMVSGNPDGHAKNEPGEPWTWWRKNTNSNECSAGAYGIDLNRNASFLWGCCGGSSPEPCNTLYRGTAPASEPEEQVIEGYVRSIFPDQRGPAITDTAPLTTTGVFITLHSYGNLVLWPWGHTNNPAPNATGLRAIGTKMATYNGYTPDQAVGLYPTDGTTDDWCYGELGVPSYTFEMGSNGDGFYPPCSRYDALIQPNIPALLYAAKIAETPYRTARGPDAESVSATPSTFVPGQDLILTATIDDGQNGGQTIAAAEAFVDTPGAEGTGIPMIASDGAFNSVSEAVMATVDTSNIPVRRQHLLLVRGRDGAGNWGPFTATFVEQPTMSIGKATTDPHPVTPGGLITYTLTAYNLGDTPLSAMIITDAIPADTAFASASPSYTLNSDVVAWTGYAIPAWDSEVFTLTVSVNQVPSGTLIVNDDYGVSSIEVPTPTHGAPVTTLVRDPALHVAKTVSADRVTPGANLVYTITVTNEGLLPTASVTVTDRVPTHAILTSATPGYALDGDAITWGGYSVPAWDSLGFTLTVTVGLVPSGTLVVNDDYWAWCTLIPTSTTGAPVITQVWEHYDAYLPLVTREWAGGVP